MEKHKSLTNRTQVEVRFSDADPLGIVWHGNFVQYMEDGREAFGKQYGLRYLDAYEHRYAMPLVNVNVDFKKTLMYGDTVIIETTYTPVTAAKINFSYKMYRLSDNVLVAIAKTTQVFITMKHELMFTNPPFFVEWKKKHGMID